jgi:hypothetical protein
MCEKGKRCNVTAVVAGRTLVLNSEWRPINILPVLKAVMKVFNSRALFVDPESCRTYDFESWVLEWDDAVRTAKIAANQVMPLGGLSLVLPDVIVCTEYRGFGYKVNTRRKPKFSRKNLYLRDRCECQYCGRHFTTKDLNMDHVVPKEKGGGVSWTNIVLSCVPCNSKKRNRTPQQAGMKLIRQPFQPTAEDLRLSPVERLKMRLTSRPPKTWEQFLGKIVSDMYWNVELLGDGQKPA